MWLVKQNAGGRGVSLEDGRKKGPVASCDTGNGNAPRAAILAVRGNPPTESDTRICRNH
jgi:hypothetical protein